MYWGINKFRDGRDLNLKAMHSHALQFIHFFGLLIEEADPVMFQLMINDNNLTHSRCKVGSAYIGVSMIPRKAARVWFTYSFPKE